MAKLGASEKPTIIRVQNINKAQEILDICEQNNWKNYWY